MKITFIGGGNMTTALIAGLQQQTFAMSNITVVEPNAEKAAILAQRYSVKTTNDMMLAAASDVIILAVKPQQLRDVTQTLAPHLTHQLVISIAAGVRTKDLSQWLKNYSTIVRCMPNTPAQIQAGITGLYANPSVNDVQIEMASNILKAAGDIIWVDQENKLDAITAISGSGPAYVFYFIEALQSAAEQLGLDREAAQLLSIHTFKGASLLAAQSDTDVATLRAQVTSKGGTTEQGLLSLEASEVKKAISLAAEKAYLRAVELGDELGTMQ